MNASAPAIKEAIGAKPPAFSDGGAVAEYKFLVDHFVLAGKLPLHTLTLRIFFKEYFEDMDTSVLSNNRRCRTIPEEYRRAAVECRLKVLIMEARTGVSRK